MDENSRQDINDLLKLLKKIFPGGNNINEDAFDELVELKDESLLKSHQLGVSQHDFDNYLGSRP